MKRFKQFLLEDSTNTSLETGLDPSKRITSKNEIFTKLNSQIPANEFTPKLDIPSDSILSQSSWYDPTNSPTTYTFAQRHQEIYGKELSDKMIDNASKAQLAAKGTSNDLTGFANVPNYRLKDKPIQSGSPLGFAVQGDVGSPERMFYDRFGKSSGAAATLPPKEGRNRLPIVFNPFNRWKEGESSDPFDLDFSNKEGHEDVHAIDDTPAPATPVGENGKSVESTIGRELSKHEKYLFSPVELPAYMAQYKQMFSKSSGRTFENGMTEKDYDDMVGAMEKATKEISTGVHPEHVELFKDPRYKKQLMQLSNQVARSDAKENLSSQNREIMA